MASRVKVAVATSLMVAALGLHGCGGDKESGSKRDVAPRAIEPCPGDSCLAEALPLMPDNSKFVAFGDRGEAAQRLGLDELSTSSSRQTLDDYESDFETPAVTGLARFLGKMVAGHAAFSDLDVRWWMQVDAGTAYRMVDDLDLDDVAQDLLDAGYDEDEVNGHRRFTVGGAAVDAMTGLVGGRYPWPQLGDLTLLPEQHLIVVSDQPDDVTAAIDGKTGSLAVPGVADLFTLRGQPEYVGGYLGDLWYQQCLKPLDRLTSHHTTTEEAERLSTVFGYRQLGVPKAQFFVAAPGGSEDVVTSILAIWASPRAAAKAADALDVFLRPGDSDKGAHVWGIRNHDFWPDIEDYNIETRGPIEIIDHEFTGGLVEAVQAFRNGDVFASCGA